MFFLDSLDLVVLMRVLGSWMVDINLERFPTNVLVLMSTGLGSMVLDRYLDILSIDRDFSLVSMESRVGFLRMEGSVLQICFANLKKWRCLAAYFCILLEVMELVFSTDLWLSLPLMNSLLSSMSELRSSSSSYFLSGDITLICCCNVSDFLRIWSTR
jgi:hypothetical protein